MARDAAGRSENRIGRYAVDAVWREEPLGRVVLARLPELGRALHILELCPPATLLPGDRARLLEAFDAECRRVVRVTDPRIPRAYDLGVGEEGTRFLAYDRPEGAGYAPLPSDPGALSPAGWTRATAEACRALAAVVGAGVPLTRFPAHCLFLSPAGEVQYLHLELDHLAARLELPEALRADGAAPPEREAPGETGLVYSAAAWLHGMLGGRDPAAGRAPGELPPALWAAETRLSATVAPALARALLEDPTARYPTLRAFAEALDPPPALQPTLHGAVPASARTVAGEPTAAWGAEPPDADAPEGTSLWRFLTWALALGAGGSLAGWGLARLLGAP